MRRLTWLIGPPGAGKSTFARHQQSFSRVTELTSMMGPLLNDLHIRKGVLTANGKLVEAIRAVELHPENVSLPPLLVVAGLVPEAALFPLSDHEEVWLLLPERERWMKQLQARPTGGGSSGQYDDIAYAEEWFGRFEEWFTRDLPIKRVEVVYDPALIGAIAR